MAVELYIGYFALYALHEPVSQCSHASGIFFHIATCKLYRCAEANDACGIFGAGPAAPLLRTAHYMGGKSYAPADIQRTHALWPVELMGGERQHVYIHGLYVYGHMAYRLYCVRVEEHALFLTHFAYLGNGHYGSHLVVCKHYGYQYGIVPDGVFYLLRRYHAVFIHGKIGHLAAMFFKVFAGMKYCVVLDICSYYVISLALVALGNAQQHGVVALCAAAGEDYLIQLCVEGLGKLLAGFVHSRLCLPPEGMHAGGVAVYVGKVRHHLLQNFRCKGRCGCVVHIYSSHVSFSSPERCQSVSIVFYSPPPYRRV